ncbi:40S ribosomal protein S15 [Zalerion maritima]|uniref:40S ribosomal protein S15 n=1 Tax=Zalerion maritima TaxID=339359 RepID=A0AAD5RMU0_9PEZI|nr:40S ribosomal protein S15 [Zalerion maritima]
MYMSPSPSPSAFVIEVSNDFQSTTDGCVEVCRHISEPPAVTSPPTSIQPLTTTSLLNPVAINQRIPARSKTAIMADEYNAEEAAEIKKRRAFRKFSYRGIELESLLDLSSDQLRDVVHARARRRINRGLKRKPMGLIKKLRKAKQEAKPNEKPDVVKTHLRDMLVVPEMIGSVIGIYSGKEFNQVEIKPEMVGHYLAEFSIS